MKTLWLLTMDWTVWRCLTRGIFLLRSENWCMNKILLFTGIVILWDSQLIFAVDHNDIIENNISCLYFHLRWEEASKPARQSVVRVGGGRFLSESRPCPQHCMEILYSSDSQRHITEQSTAMTQSFLCLIVLILFSPLFLDGLPSGRIVMIIFLKMH